MEKKALVIGLGVSGRAAIELLKREGYSITGVDRKDVRTDPDLFSIEVFTEAEEIGEKEFSLVVLSPGIPRSHPLVIRAEEKGIPIFGEVDFAIRFLRNRAVAITGTNGKTTVTELVEHVLCSSGKKARSLGNIGLPLAAYALEPDEEEILVVELSSYQLETLSTTLFSSAVLLNITPDHLDRYLSMEAYAKAKARLQHCISPEGKLYLNHQVARQYRHLFDREFVIIGEGTSSISLPESYPTLGVHDRENAQAAWALCKDLEISEAQFLQALATFKKPPHRIEFVRKIRGVSYYDDSKGTNIDAVISSVKSIEGSIILIAGGVDKGSSYLPWKKIFTNRVRKIFVIGEAAKKISSELGLFFNVEIVDSLEKAVKESAKIASWGESVLLSPGCSSFDMFRDYVHRGEEFQKIVGLLEEE